jgi:outer membrane lipoprotein-sorting protein
MTLDNNHSEKNPIFKAVDTMTPEPDKQFLQELRTRSAQAFLKAAAHPTTVAPPVHSETRWRFIMHSRMLRVATAAVILFAVILGISLFNTTQNSAYAEVIQMLQEARTLVYTLVTQANDPAGQTVITRWQYKDPALLRTSTEGGHVTVIDGAQGRQMSLVPETKTVIEGEFAMSEVEADDAFAVVNSLRALPAQADEELDAKVLNGRSAKGYRVTSGDSTTTVWIDSATRDLVQVEQTYASAPGMNFVMTDFQFDAILDDSLFALTPPAGYNKTVDLVANSMGSEEAFVTLLRYWSTELVTDQSFPPIVLGPQLSKVMMDMAIAGKFHKEKAEQIDQQAMYEAFLWVASLPKESNWRYLGANVTYGDSATPIFWYQPAGQATYRVIYADLSIQEVLSEDLPK